MPDANNIKAEEREAMPKAIDTGIILLIYQVAVVIYETNELI